MTQSIPQTLPELQPCPFCDHSIMHMRHIGQMQQAHCDGCGSAGPLFTEARPAIEAWNRRAALAAQPLVGVIPEERITEEMHIAAVKVLHRATGVDGLPQRMLDAMRAAAPQPPAVQQDRGEADSWADYKERCEHGVRWETPCSGCGRAPSGVDAAAQGAAWKCPRCGSSSVDACNGVGCFAGESSAQIEDWQLIETVPQSEERFLVISRSGRITIDTGHFMHNMMHAAKVDGDECFYTHWRIIPPPPSIGTPPQGVGHG